MSHVSKLKTSITNPQALVRALVRIGIPMSRIEIHEQAQQCCGFHKEEKFMANVIVRKSTKLARGGCDIGWEKTEDGTYTAHVDDYNYGGGQQHYSSAWQTQVATYSNVETAKIEMEKRDIEYEEVRDDKNRIQIVARFKLEDGGRRVLREGR
jgi:hypothetical protein